MYSYYFCNYYVISSFSLSIMIVFIYSFAFQLYCTINYIFYLNIISTHNIPIFYCIIRSSPIDSSTLATIKNISQVIIFLLNVSLFPSRTITVFYQVILSQLLFIITIFNSNLISFEEVLVAYTYLTSLFFKESGISHHFTCFLISISLT